MSASRGGSSRSWAGPRQVGKTTLARQFVAAAGLPTHYASADEAVGFDRAWISAQWELGRAAARCGNGGAALLVLDEVQKVPGGSDVVKVLWDENTTAGAELRVLILGSSPLLVHRGSSDSLAGRFEPVRLSHWSFAENDIEFANVP